MRRKTQFIEILELGTVVQGATARSCQKSHGHALVKVAGTISTLARHWQAFARHWLVAWSCKSHARSCMCQHYHAWPSTTWLHGRASVTHGRASVSIAMHGLGTASVGPGARLHYQCNIWHGSAHLGICSEITEIPNKA
ncbi:hypothetical protein E3N88_38449 [Mikania micrantha]|uniref:Uncharacterized protein n=1 Tax=Mikania micrantha TaxID=192012 RepID=A0A5N6LWK4_9ASTR|nr:hypothetical protein E3N88_38449 [Mikania micrantha]